MLRIDLARLAKARAGKGPKRTVVFRPIMARQGAVDDLERVIVGIHRAVRGRATEAIVAAATGAVAAIHDDESGRLGSAFGLFRTILAAALTGIVTDLVIDRIFDGEESRHRQRLIEQARSRVGIDLEHIISRDNLSEAINLSIGRSVRLIAGLNEELARRVETQITNAVMAGMSSRGLAKILREQFGWSAKRAKIIARDQIASFNGNLNRLRQLQLGITKYKWATALDERVRGNPDGRYPRAIPSHWDREGKTFEWAKPPEGGHPGEAILCRCVGQAILEF